MNHTSPHPASPPERLYELLEVLRPDVEEDKQDAAREELADLLEKHPHLIETWHEIARVDDLLAEATQDVVVPEGLDLRILDAVESHKSVLAKATTYKRRAGRLSRFVVPVVACSLVAVTFVCGYLALNRSTQWQKDQVLAAATELFDASESGSVSAKDFSASLSKSDQELLEGYLPSEDVLKPQAATWEVVDNFLGRRAVVYRFKDRHGNRAALFVIQQEQPVHGLIDRPPLRPQSMTAGRSAGAWQSDQLLYILVSSGNEPAWRSLLVPERPVT